MYVIFFGVYDFINIKFYVNFNCVILNLLKYRDPHYRYIIIIIILNHVVRVVDAVTARRVVTVSRLEKKFLVEWDEEGCCGICGEVFDVSEG